MTLTEQKLNEIGFDILKKAENLFGSREVTKFNGFKFWTENKQPELTGNDKNGYTINISNIAVDNEVEARYQISHEVIHLLSPTSYKNVSVLEEGIATYFSIYYLKSIGHEEIANKYLEFARTNYHKYFEAYRNVEKIDNLFETMKAIRESNPKYKLSDLTHNEISELEQRHLIEPLLKKFNCS